MAKGNNPLPLYRLVEQGEQTSHLLRMLRRQQALLEEVRARLPDPLGSHCLHARISGNTLILHVDSPAWASRLRFQSNALLQALREQAPGLKKLSVRQLLPEAPRPRRTAGSPASPSPLRESIADDELRGLLKPRPRD